MIRLQLITLCRHSESFVNSTLKDVIADNIKQSDDIEVVDASPDVAHIFGLWTTKSAKVAHSLQSRGIAVVFTSINGMARLLNNYGEPTSDITLKNVVRRLAKHAIIHCSGNSEENVIGSIARKSSTTLIANALITSTTNTELMCQDFHDLYAEIYKRQEQEASKDIESEISQKVKTEDKAIRDICSRLLYLKYLYRKKSIRQEVLDDVSTLMTRSNYDEALMRNILDDLHLSSFASSCMCLLEKCSSLTEGFMPIKATEDKTALRMQEMIIQ